MRRKAIPAMGNNRGIALLITLAVITVLMTITVELNRRARSSITAAAAARNRMTLEAMASSGIQGAMALLIQDKINDPPSGLDSIQEKWADSEGLTALAQSLAFESGAVEIKITDELSKIQVNTLVQFPGGKEANNLQMFLWERFIRIAELSGEDMAEFEPRTIINSLKDWLDSGDDDAITGMNGAESDYYQSLDPPYECKNGPLNHLDELTLIRGVTPELYYGLEGMFGISNYATTTMGPPGNGQNDYFTGKINLNTAELPVIAALLPEGSEMLGPNILEYREEMSEDVYIHDLSNINWYKNASGCSDLKIDEALITGFSDYFKIESKASMGDMDLSVTALIQRVKKADTGKWECKVLSWQQE
ncbi:MAG: type II secretion system minor pseudopilin GspK [Proteobacteria bacterium]|nr:type II secretion system minor pseudopilin GspK [Pseudomonadota bacterium]MBU4469305.1 type II secretion system minor pseudopilin GspK [Pseudomonadota bacterium]MCG2750784.1 type II secretion system minor pseudopilin GspK [Desulfobacteraceae bacterium]